MQFYAVYLVGGYSASAFKGILSLEKVEDPSLNGCDVFASHFSSWLFCECLKGTCCPIDKDGFLFFLSFIIIFFFTIVCLHLLS